MFRLYTSEHKLHRYRTLYTRNTKNIARLWFQGTPETVKNVYLQYDQHLYGSLSVIPNNLLLTFLDSQQPTADVQTGSIYRDLP